MEGGGLSDKCRRLCQCGRHERHPVPCPYRNRGGDIQRDEVVRGSEGSELDPVTIQGAVAVCNARHFERIACNTGAGGCFTCGNAAQQAQF